MKNLFISSLAGLSCLPLVYDMVRSGSIWLAFTLVMLIGALCGLLAQFVETKTGGRSRWWHCAIGFTGGAFFGEAISFINYYNDYGYRDAKLSVGIALSILEFGAIAAIGSVSGIVARASINLIRNRMKIWQQ